MPEGELEDAAGEVTGKQQDLVTSGSKEFTTNAAGAHAANPNTSQPELDSTAVSKTHEEPADRTDHDCRLNFMDYPVRLTRVF